jgi:arylsulfatase A-like enzyme
MNIRILLVVTLVLLCTQRLSAAERPPNIVILLADDLGYGETGCQGNPQIPTPNIDGIAQQGVRFTNGYVTAPFCSASRAGLITGRYQTRFGYEFNPIGARNEDPNIGLPPGQRTIADHLRGRGYATGLVGKWHLGGTANYHPQRRGFDDFFGFMHEGHYFAVPPYRGIHTFLRRKVLPPGSSGRWISSDGRLILSSHMGHNEPPYDANNPILRGSQPVQEDLFLTDAFTRESVDFIRRNAERPFFLYVAYNAVHSPLQADDERWSRFAEIKDSHRRIFAAMLAGLDDSVGTIVSELHEQGLERNTLIFFLSDNGGPTKELTSSNLPLRAGKGSLYEGGIRIPFLMSWPGTIPSGQTRSHPVVSLDIAATAYAAAGSAAESEDGVDLLPLVTGTSTAAPHDVLFWRTGPKAALRKGDWKLVRNSRAASAAWQLFDLSDDISEEHDLASAQPQQRAKLLQEWEQLNDEMIQPAWTR